MFGSHLSIAGGLVNALIEAERLKMDTVQIFTKNQRQWRTKPLDDDAADAWVAKQADLGWEGRTVAHDSYLINLASPDDALWEKSINLMREEFARCERLRIAHLVSHPGAHTGSGVDAGLERIADAYARILPDVRSSSVILCLEDTAGSGTTLGRTFEELADLRARIIKRVGRWASNRVGFCLDTCHLLAAGYDITTSEKTSQTLATFDRVCSVANLRVLHLNDSKGALGSRIDRHEHIGAGCVGKGAFEAIVNDERLSAVPKILETPKGDTPKGTPWDTVNLRRLRALMGVNPSAGAGDADASGRGTTSGRGRKRRSVSGPSVGARMRESA